MFREELGRHAWTVLHSSAFHGDRQSVVKVLDHYPCAVCKKSISKFRTLSYFQQVPESKDALKDWVFHLHNSVSLKLGKPLFDMKAPRLLEQSAQAELELSKAFLRKNGVTEL